MPWVIMWKSWKLKKYVCDVLCVLYVAAGSPEGSQAVGDNSRVQVVDNADSKETEHGHTERGQPDSHRSHPFSENTLSLSLLGQNGAVLTTRRLGGTSASWPAWRGSNKQQQRLNTPTCSFIHTSAFVCRLSMSTVDEVDSKLKPQLIPAVS